MPLSELASMKSASQLPEIGVDIVDCDRIRRVLERHDSAFLERVFTPEEVAYCLRMKDPAPHLAARFAAKEAVAKALGTGIGAAAAFRDIEVRREDHGAPSIKLHNAAAQTAQQLNIRHIQISLSHTSQQAIAMVLACP